jgi:calcium-translocating P-type ATPase
VTIQHQTVAEALASLHTSLDGLTAAEAQRRLREFGPNQIEQARPESGVAKFFRGFTHLFALILWLAAALALFAELGQPGQGMAALGWAIIGVIAINGTFSFWQEHRAERAIAALQKLLPHQVKVIRDGKVHQISTTQVAPGDLLLLEAGDDIPADSRVIEARGVRVNAATVSGESVPVAKHAEPSDNDDAVHSANILLAGTSMVAGDAQAVVFATGMRTEFGKIAHLTQSGAPPQSPLQQQIAHLSRLIAVIATALGIGFFFVGRALGLPFWDTFIFAIGIIVANVPEGLLPTVTLAMAMGSQRMARQNTLIRHLPSVETLGSTTVICTDKTGTLTENTMRARRIFLAGQLYHVDDLRADVPFRAQAREFLETLLHCENVKEAEVEGSWRLVGDPTEVALLEMTRTMRPDLIPHPRLDEIPFDSNRKRLSTLHRTPVGLMLYSKGALETVLPCCDRVQMGGHVEPLTGALRHAFLSAQDAMAEDGFRVLAVAHRPVDEPFDRDALEMGLTLTGLVGLEDPPRPEAPDAVRKCHEAGIRVIMVTGDHPHTARAIGREIGLIKSSNPVVVTGDQLRRMTDTRLQLVLDAPEILFARTGADHKVRIVKALQRKQHIVAVTGDGVNDAPALRAADIGIAMGVTGTDVARESAHMILLDDNFASIVAAIEEGRAVYDNIRKFLTYILTSNIPEIVPYLAFVLFKIPLPLTILQILAVDLGTDMVPALGLGAEKPDPLAMQRPPRPRAERLLNWPLLRRAYLFLGPLEAVAAMSAFFFVLEGGGWHYGEKLASTDLLYRQATSACLGAIIVTQISNVFLCRNDRASAFGSSPISNRLILAGVGLEIVLIGLITYSPLGNRIFVTSPIDPSVWLFILPFVATMVALEEGRKWIVRRGRAGMNRSPLDVAAGTRER